MNKKILNAINDRSDEIIDFVRELIRTPSVNPPGDETKVAAVIIKKMEELGITDVKTLEKEKGRPNILGSLHGSKKRPILMLSGHIDTKPAGLREKWSVDPFSAEIREGKIFGRGAVDMKSGVGAMIMAVGAIKETGIKLGGNIMLAMVADEEHGSALGTKWLVEDRLIKADAAIVGEASGIERPFENLSIATRGLVVFDIVVGGTQLHSSISDIKGAVNASVKLSNVISRMANELKLTHKSSMLYPQGVTINLGETLKGGVHYGMVPGRAIAGNDIRVLPGMTLEQTIKDIETFLEKLRKEDPQLDVKIELVRYLEPTEVSPKEPIVRVASKACEEVLGFKPKPQGFPAGTDARYLINQGNIPAIPALGPGLIYLAHATNERVSIKSVIDATKIYALTAINYLK